MGRTILTGRYVPDRVITHEPAGIYEEPAGEGLMELHTEPLSVITIMPRPVPHKRTKNLIRKAVVLGSAIGLPVAFVALADVLVSSPQLFFGSCAACFGWPAIVFWANYRD